MSGATRAIYRLPMHRPASPTWLLLALVVAACGTSPPTTTANLPTTTSPSLEVTTTNPAVATTTSSPTTTLPEIDVDVVGGEATGEATFTVGVGETVDIWVRSDVDDELHVHGYDLVLALAAGVPTQVTFRADVPGVFEVEVHTGHAEIFVIEVIG